MITKDKKFQLRLSEQELYQLKKLAERSGVSASDYLRSFIRREAKRRKMA
ncbi:MAG: hypothetical protein R3282_06595 [Rhodothermales bacterium]|nr:hypothetical protein [Rhodothermales bacterium]